MSDPIARTTQAASEGPETSDDTQRNPRLVQLERIRFAHLGKSRSPRLRHVVKARFERILGRSQSG